MDTPVPSGWGKGRPHIRTCDDEDITGDKEKNEVLFWYSLLHHGEECTVQTPKKQWKFHNQYGSVG